MTKEMQVKSSGMGCFCVSKYCMFYCVFLYLVPVSYYMTVQLGLTLHCVINRAAKFTKFTRVRETEMILFIQNFQI